MQGVILYGPLGTGKAYWSNITVGTFVLKHFFEYIIAGESARLFRELFNYARDHQPCIIFMDEIDAIGRVGCSLQFRYIMF